MYLNYTHLPHILRPHHYHSEEQDGVEREQLFSDAWHLVGCTADLPNDDDYLTIQVMETPLIIWRSNGAYKAFLNVCPHRFSRLAGCKIGNSKTIQCPYHGWEYDACGATRRIPDAKHFKPLTKDRVALVQFSLERLGQLLFVRLTPDGPTLRDYLGPAYEECLKFYDDDWELIWTWQPDLEGNWKLGYEITMENYHVGVTHAKTLGKFPLAADDVCSHELHGPRHSVFRADRNNDQYLAINFERFAMKQFGGTAECQYVHWHVYPHASFFSQNIFSVAQAVYPISPNRYLNLYRLFLYRGNKRGIGTYMLRRFLKRVLRKLWTNTFLEDAEAVRLTQEGLSSNGLHLEGLLSVREERIFHFQEYIKNNCNLN